jgi:hypothetical protein
LLKRKLNNLKLLLWQKSEKRQFQAMPGLLLALFVKARTRIHLRFLPSSPTAKFASAEAQSKWLSQWRFVRTARETVFLITIECPAVSAVEEALLLKLEEKKGAKNAGVMGKIQNPAFPVQAVMVWGQYKIINKRSKK